MVIVSYDHYFEKQIRKIKDASFKQHIITQISKVVNNPLIGKPMRYQRSGTREVYIGSFRLVYSFNSNIIIFLELYHKDEQ